MYLFPAIDMINQQVVRLHQGNYAEQTTYHDDPVAQAKLFEDAGATWLHVVDLDGAKSGKPEHLDMITRICSQTSLKVEVGGGIRDEQTITQLLNAGIERAILGTAALQNWDWFKQTVHDPRFHHKIVLGLDARKGKLAIAGWEIEMDKTALEVAQEVSDWPLAAIVFTDIATDGTLKGPNVESTNEIANATKVPVVASGGVGTLEHLKALRTINVQGTIVGRALYDGTITIEDALKTVEG